MTREQTITRLRLWAQRAQAEANQADRRTDTLNWLGQSQVLSGVAEYLAGHGSDLDPAPLRVQVIGGRQKALAAWDLARTNEQDVALHAGEVAGYDLALLLLKDAGAAWSN